MKKLNILFKVIGLVVELELDFRKFGFKVLV